jgi:hypothetical protein
LGIGCHKNLLSIKVNTLSLLKNIFCKGDKFFTDCQEISLETIPIVPARHAGFLCIFLILLKSIGFYKELHDVSKKHVSSNEEDCRRRVAGMRKNSLNE